MNTSIFSPTFSIIYLALVFLCLFFLQRQKKLEKLLREKETGLEKTSFLLMGKNVELIDQNVKQQKLLESKEDFVSIVSHQLRTPATEIKWAINEIRSDKTWELSSEHRAQIENLYKSSEGMVRLISSLLHLVSLEQGFNNRFSIAPYEVDSLIQGIAEHLAKDFAHKNINLSLDLQYKSVISSIDTDSLSMVIQNLIENAFQYSLPDGKIVVESKRENPSGLTVSVKDTGIGISVAKQKTIFLKFKRSTDAMEMNAGGMGLGLYIMKNVIGQYGGTVGFNSKQGEGTTFYFTLPEKSSKATT